MTRYTVETYDNYDRPHERRFRKVAEFDTPAQAIACAKKLIRSSLEKLWHPGATPMQLFAEWANAGDGVRIQGRLPVTFNPYDYAKGRTIGPRSSRLSDRLSAPEQRFLGW